MQDKQLLADLLAAETEEAALEILNKQGLLSDETRWRFLGCHSACNIDPLSRGIGVQN
jgi:hypothetical protein